MADSEDWRRQRAEELAFRRPPEPAVAKPSPNARPIPAPSPAAAHANHTAAPSTPRSPTDAPPTHASDVRRWQGIALALALLLALTIGWVVHDLVADSAPAPAPVIAAEPGGEPLPVPVPDMRTAAPEPLPPAEPRILSEPQAAVPAPAPDIPVPTPSTLIRQKHAPPPATAEAKAKAPAKAARPAPTHAARKSSRVTQPARSCSRSGATVYRLICTDPALAARDARLNRLYRRAMTRADKGLARRIDRDQAEFLNRRSNCEDARCIARLTDRRIDRLAGFVGDR